MKSRNKTIITVLCILNALTIMNGLSQSNTQQIDNSNKSILARGCDPHASLEASKMIPPLIGHPKYVPTTNDADFIEKLKTQKWSVIFFAPGACRYSAAKMQIPGGNEATKAWTLEEYRALVYKYQGKDVQIVTTTEEYKTVSLLTIALEKAPTTK